MVKLIKYQNLLRVFEAIVGKFVPEISYPVRAFLIENVTNLRILKEQFFLFKKLIVSNRDGKLFYLLSHTISNNLSIFFSEKIGSLICFELLSALIRESGDKPLKNKCLDLIYYSIERNFADLCGKKYSLDIFQLLINDTMSHKSFMKFIKLADLSEIASSKHGMDILFFALDKFNLKYKKELFKIVFASNYHNIKAIRNFLVYMKENYSLQIESNYEVKSPKMPNSSQLEIPQSVIMPHNYLYNLYQPTLSNLSLVNCSNMTGFPYQAFGQFQNAYPKAHFIKSSNMNSVESNLYNHQTGNQMPIQMIYNAPYIGSSEIIKYPKKPQFPK